MSDEFDNIFDNLNYEDFLTPVQTSGVPLPHTDRDFEEFFTEHLAAVRRAFSKVGEALTMVAYLAVDDRKWSFAPTAEETLDQFLERVHVEAQMLGAKMLFLHRRTRGGSVEVPIDEAGSPVANFERVLASGAPRACMFYFAGHKHGAVNQFRHGIMLIEDGELGDPIEGYGDLRDDPFAQILR